MKTIIIECKYHRQWLDQKPAPYTDNQSIDWLDSYYKPKVLQVNLTCAKDKALT